MSLSSLEQLRHFEIPGKVAFFKDANGLIKINITTAFSTAEVYLQGAHVTAFQKKGEDPMLFMSSSGRMARGNMLHGGIPLCFPWFGKHAHEELSHGFARLHPWDLKLVGVTSKGSVLLHFELPQEFFKAAGWLPVVAMYRIVVGEKLKLDFQVCNPPTNTESFLCEDCFHSYFLVDDVEQVTIRGLKDHHYLDKTQDLVSKLELSDEIRITQETNRIYLNATGTVDIHDPLKKRIIRIEKKGSLSTVLWNPWIENAKSIPDFDPEDFKKMICVESGNVGQYAKEIPPGETWCLFVDLSTIKDAS